MLLARVVKSWSRVDALGLLASVVLGWLAASAFANGRGRVTLNGLGTGWISWPAMVWLLTLTVVFSARVCAQRRGGRTSFQFRLRTLFVVTLAASALFAWLGIMHRQAVMLEEGIRTVEDCGAVVLRRGDGSVQAVAFGQGSTVTEKETARLRLFDTLEQLTINNRNIGDASLREVQGLRNLEVLVLLNTKVTDEGLAHIKSLGNLRRLILGLSESLTGEGLVHLEELPHLEVLVLDGARGTDVWLQRLRTLSNSGRFKVGLANAELSDDDVGLLTDTFGASFLGVERATSKNEGTSGSNRPSQGASSW
jgi:hypothetical protein